MTNIEKAACFVTLFVTSTAIVQAQATRTWVSGVGDDANPCSRTAPCKTFAGAISKTAPSGEINVLDPGGFGAVTITKSITIDGSGGSIAGVLVSGTNAIVVSAGANDVVNLRNLDINGLGTGLNGVRLISGKEVRLERVLIYGFTQNGVSQEALGSSVFVSDSIIRNNTGNAVFVSGGGGSSMRLNVIRSSLESNGKGIVVRDSGRAVVVDSSISKNTGAGLQANSNLSIGTSEISAEHCLIAHNGTGVLAGDPTATVPSDVWLSNNQIADNVGNGVQLSTNGHVFTYMNNQIQGNGVDGCPGCSMMGFN